MATIRRGPTIFRSWLRDPNGVAIGSVSYVWENRLINLYVGQDKLPNLQDDWPNPTLPKSRFAAISTRADVETNRLLDLLKSKDTFFYGVGRGPNYDWPNPTLPKSRWAAIESQTGVREDRLLNLYIGKDKFFRGVGQAPNYDWQNPTLAKTRFVAQIAQDQVWQNLDNTLRVPNIGVLRGQLTVQYFPRVPRDVAMRAQAEVDQNALILTLKGQDQFFGAPGQVQEFDWPNPVWPQSRLVAINSQTWANGAFNPGELQPPFSQDDWFRPQARQFGIESQITQNLLNTVLAAALPFFETEWPNPQVRKSGIESQVAQNLLNTLLVPPVVASPFYQTEWPNPQAHDGTVPPGDFQSMLALFLTPPTPEPEPIVTGGHWLKPTRAEAERIAREIAAADKAREELWAARLRDQREMHAQIMAQLHPERVLGQVGVIRPTAPLHLEDDEDEDDIEFLMLYGV